MVFCNELHKIDNGIKSIFYMENKSMVYEIKIYEEQLKSEVIEFYKNVLPESGRELDLNGKHKVFQDIQNNYEKMCLDTLSTSKKAIKLYKAAGFKEIVRYNDNMTADVFMEKDL